MANLLKEFGVDKKKQVEGEWVRIFSNAEFKIAAWQNEKHKSFLRKKVKLMFGKKYDSMMENDWIKLAKEQPEDIVELELLGIMDSILTDWKNVEFGEDVKSLAFNQKNVEIVLRDERVGESIIERIKKIAREKETYKLEFEEVAAKK